MKKQNYELVGFVAAFLTTTAYIPQVFKTWRNVPKPALDISLSAFAMLFAGISLWFLYGILVKKPSLIVANGITIFLSFAILAYKLIYG